MSVMENIFSLWPSLVDMAKDLGRGYPTVAAWKQRGSIPAKYDLDLVEAAERRGAVLSLADLAEARRAPVASGAAA